MTPEPPIGRIAVRMDALAAALSAKVGMVELRQLERLEANAAAHLDQDDELRRPIAAFCVAARADRRDPDALHLHGVELLNALGEPERRPAWMNRRDING